MKPCLYFRRGVWCCSVPGWTRIVLGHGYTPKEAYDDWRQQVEAQAQ